jgi:hypothetical protein
VLNFNKILYPIDLDKKHFFSKTYSSVFDSTDVNIIDTVLLAVLVISEKQIMTYRRSKTG